MLPDKLQHVTEIIGNLDGYLKKLLSIEDGTVAGRAFDFTYSVIEGGAPIVSNILQGLQIRKLSLGLNALNKVVQEMNVVLKESEEKFIQEKALPLILKNIAQEEQEEKIRIMINGFESIIYDSMYNEDHLYEYYDVLESLRKKDIARMLYLYNEEMEDQETYNIKNLGFDGTSVEYIDNKLVQLGLRRIVVIDGGNWSAPVEPQDTILFTNFGMEFIKFFRSRENH